MVTLPVPSTTFFPFATMVTVWPSLSFIVPPFLTVRFDTVQSPVTIQPDFLPTVMEIGDSVVVVALSLSWMMALPVHVLPLVSVRLMLEMVSATMSPSSVWLIALTLTVAPLLPA